MKFASLIQRYTTYSIDRNLGYFLEKNLGFFLASLHSWPSVLEATS